LLDVGQGDGFENGLPRTCRLRRSLTTTNWRTDTRFIYSNFGTRQGEDAHMQFRTRRLVLSSAVALGLVVVVAASALAQAGNPNIGMWKGNVAKSTMTTGTKFTTNTTKIVAAGAGITSTVDTTYVDGTGRHWRFTANYDGKDSPITGNSPYGDTVALTRVDANTTRTVYKKAGVVTATQTTVVSADGKTRTVTSKGKNAAGQAVDCE